jgi:hypothetical protein
MEPWEELAMGWSWGRKYQQSADACRQEALSAKSESERLDKRKLVDRWLRLAAWRDRQEAPVNAEVQEVAATKIQEGFHRFPLG